jgi:hypothetical protein
LTIGADPSTVQEIADIDDEMLRDPTIREVLQASGSDGPDLNEEEMTQYLQGLETA